MSTELPWALAPSWYRLSAADALEQIATMRARAIEVLVNMVSLLFELVLV
jgi:hypothetical protein